MLWSGTSIGGKKGSENRIILKPKDHLVCYDIELLPGSSPPINFEDQFTNSNTLLLDVNLLCVPSLKEEVVQVEENTWGKIKSIYR